MRVMVLTDGKRLPVSEREELAISAELNDQDSDRVEIQGVPYKKTLIGYFDNPTPEEAEARHATDAYATTRILPKGKQCIGSHSVQKKINQLAMKHGGKVSDFNPEGVGWAKLIRDLDWRTMMRETLLESGKAYCDYRTGTCLC